MNSQRQKIRRYIQEALSPNFSQILQGTAGRVSGEEGFLVINIPRIKMEVIAKSPRIYSAELQLELSIVLWEQANISDELEEKAERVCDVFSKDRFFGGLVGDSVLGEVRFRFDDSSERVLGVCEIEYLLRYDEMQVS